MKLTEIAYFTDNVKGMAAFYQELLLADPDVLTKDIAIFHTGETRIFIHCNYETEPGGLPPEAHKAFQVENVDQECNRLVRVGFNIEVEPRDYYWGRSAYLRDPDGHLIELTEAGTE